ncbi:MAG: hypothetical protein WBQ37_06200 [Candidatus Competibacter sp.]
MADDPTPHWQPLAALPLIASLIDGELADGQEHYATLLAARDRPYVLDDATIERSIKLHTEQRDFLGVFRRAACPLAPRTAHEHSKPGTGPAGRAA